MRRHKTAAVADGVTTRDEANVLAAYAFRNGFLEELHAGMPAGFSDEEMKKLMIEASARLAVLLFMRRERPDLYTRFLESYSERLCRTWERTALSYELPTTARAPCGHCAKDVRPYWTFCASCGARIRT